MTGVGVEAVVEGCTVLEMFDVSQCKNLGRWLEAGGVERMEEVYRGRSERSGKKKLVFETKKGDGGLR